MTSLKIIFKFLPWLLLGIIILTLYITNHWPFSREGAYQHLLDSSVILKEVENLGKMELVKYNFSEVFEYKRLSNGKIIGNTIFNTNSYDPDLSVLLIASGEAVGCIDLTKVKTSDITISSDSIILYLPTPELCYHKLNLEKTKIYSFSKESWWSRLFSNEKEKNEVLQFAYRKAELKMREAAIESGIYRSTNDNAKIMLIPLFEKLTGKTVGIVTALPQIELDSGL